VSGLRRLQASAALVRRHAGLYLSLAFVIAVTVVVTTAQLSMYGSLTDGRSVDTSGLSAIETAALHDQLAGFGTIAIAMALLTSVIATFLVAGGARNVIDQRRRELLTLRLSGASAGQVRRMIAVEGGILGGVVAVPAALAGFALTPALFGLFQWLRIYGSQLTVSFPIRVDLLLIVVVVAAGACAIACWWGARGMRADRLLAAQFVRPRWRIVTGVVVRVAGTAAIVASTFALQPGKVDEGTLALATPVLITAGLMLLAPVIVPAVAALVGVAIRPVLPGTALLVAQRARKDGPRFVRMITPLILAAGLFGGFQLGNVPDQAMRAAANDRFYTANSAVALASDADASAAAKALRAAGAAEVTRWGSGRVRTTAGTSVPIEFVDAATVGGVTNLAFSPCRPSDLRGRSVASGRSSDRIGDRIEIVTDSGTTALTVAALIGDPALDGLLLADWSAGEQWSAAITGSYVFAQLDVPVGSPAWGTLAAELERQGGTLLTKSEFLAAREAARAANSYRGNIAVFGTIYLMAVVAIVQTAITNAGTRRREFDLYRSLGVGSRGVLGILGVESLVLTGVAATLLSGAFVAIGLRFATGSGATAWLDAATLANEMVAALPLIGTVFAMAAVAMSLGSLAGGMLALGRPDRVAVA
jgi:putative ABC transport system permease protein